MNSDEWEYTHNSANTAAHGTGSDLTGDESVARETTEGVDEEAASRIIEGRPVAGGDGRDVKVGVDGVGRRRWGLVLRGGRHGGKEKDGLGGREVQRFK